MLLNKKITEQVLVHSILLVIQFNRVIYYRIVSNQFPHKLGKNGEFILVFLCYDHFNETNRSILNLLQELDKFSIGFK